jgi:hypothetical protein
MKRSLVTLSAAFAAGTLMLAVGVPTALAALSDPEIKCFAAIAKAGEKFVKTKYKAIEKCTEKNLKLPGDCDVPLEQDAKVAAAEAKMRTKLDDSDCAFLAAFQFAEMGFPGACPDPHPGRACVGGTNDGNACSADSACPGGTCSEAGFTYNDLKECLVSSHENIVDGLMEVDYGTTTGPLPKPELDCQKAISKNGLKYLDARLKAVQKCRNNLLTGKISGFSTKDCDTADPTTAEKIAKADSKARAGIAKKCIPDSVIANLDACNPPADTLPDLQDCIIQTHGDAADSPDPTKPADLIDFEYATPSICGDGVVNDINEECDGTDDALCPGLCGSPTGFFACLCLDKKRERVIEHSNSDLDNGWTGQAHDQGTVEGGGYVADLYDCDGPAGPDTLCTVGPSCTGGAHVPCVQNSDCGINGPCRKERTAVGPHCNLNIQQACTTDSNCTGTGNFCATTFHGPPLPLAAGAVAVCVVNIFTEDVVGTSDLASGSSAVRIRQNSNTYLGGDQSTIATPCPLCGGFCSPVNATDKFCTVDADCGVGSTCITAPICSRGINEGKDCRPDPPYGGTTAIFGNPSVDCPPNGTLIGTIDILFNPATTGAVALIPNQACGQSGFAGVKTCVGGGNEGATCTTGTQCPGGTCNDQCFCPNTPPGAAEAPNQCLAACVGGTNDAADCSVASECPGGFCHLGDCRDAGISDPGGEGVCTTGPSDQTCSQHNFQGCTTDAQCKPSRRCIAGANVNALCTTASECPGSSCDVGCSVCFESETCVNKQRECFVNSGIHKTGTADPDNPETVAAFCITRTASPATNNTAGLPGPGAIRQPATVVRTGFP